MWRFVTIVVSIMLALDLFWWWRGDAWARRLPRPKPWRIGWSLFMLLQTSGMLLLMFARTLGLDRTAGLPTSFLIFLFVWHLLVLPATIIVALLGNAGWSVAKLFALLGRKTRSAEPEAPALTDEAQESAFSRREFFATAVVALPPLVTVIGSAYAIPQLDSFRVRRFTVDLPSLPRDLDGMTIAQVADIHVGDFTQGQTLRDIIEATNGLKPDLVLMTGDLINRRLSDLPAALDMVRRFDPKHGLFNCEGNHDLFEGREAFAAGVRRAGVPMLINSSETIRIKGHPVQILGMQWGPRRGGGEAILETSMRALLPQRDPDAFPILIAHHPHAFDYAAPAGIPLTFAGHTHGGQLHLTPRIGFGSLMYKYWSGLYRKDDAALVVSNGVGNWFPLRINAPAEIIHVTLRSA